MSAAAALLAVTLPQRAAAAHTRHDSFGCGGPRGGAAAWSVPQRRAVLIASLAMLPMMCGLPLTVGLCRSDSISPQLALNVRFAAMFAPALLIAHRPPMVHAAPHACAVLLGVGALALLLDPGAFSGWELALAHGAAWSMAWAAMPGNASMPCRAHGAPLPSAATNAFIVATGGLVV